MKVLPFFLFAFHLAAAQDSSYFYLGQIPPGEVPGKFELPVTPGFTAAERIAITADGKEIIYGEINGYGKGTAGRIRCMKFSDGRWTGPFTLIERPGNPGLTIDDRTLFFAGGWCLEQSATGWTNPHPFWNTSHKIHYPQQTANGTLYLMSDPQGSGASLMWCRLIIGTSDTTLEPLGSPPNVQDHGMDFFIARDESYMIMVLKPGMGRECGGFGDLFISFRKNGNSWTEPESLGPSININDPADGRWGPYVTADNKYLFYTHGKNLETTGINWVRFDRMLERLRH